MRGFWLLLAAISFYTAPALAEKRVALVIGNSNYANVSRLTNPVNDASAVASILKNAAFDAIEIKRDLKIAEMRRVLRDFADKARDADIAVVYYAGHGIEVDGANYLIPIDAALERDVDVFDETIPVDRILSVIDPAKQLRLVILDACRDNPFAKTMKRSVGQRSVGRGFAKVEPTSPNTMIAFAAKAGSTAADGDSANSPFTAALVKHIATPGLDLRRAFGFVRDDVLKATGNRQEPYVYGSLGGEDFPLVPAKPMTDAPTANPNAEIRRDYELALQIATRQVWTAFLKQYPDGFYAALATEQLNKITADEAKAKATEKARLAQEEKARLAAEGARQAEQKKAAEMAEAAEKAKLAAEQKQMIEAAKAKAAEESRAALERAAAEKATAAQAEAARQTEAKEAAAERAAADRAAADERRLATLSPDAPSPAKADSSSFGLARSIQTELRRVGCYVEKIDDDWSVAARRSLEKFNRRAGMKLDIKLASLDVLDAIKTKPSRICPLECERGYRADGERCVKITCTTGSFLNEKSECEKVRPRRTEIRKPTKPASNAVDVPKTSPPAISNSFKPLYCEGKSTLPRSGCN